MSKLIAKIVRVDEVRTHGNADNLDLVQILGYQCVTKKNEFKVGDLAVYFPPDTMFYYDMAQTLGIANYLSEKLTADPAGQTVRAGKTKVVKLRGEPSFGILIPVAPQKDVLGSLCEEGSVVNDVYKVWKYEPPIDTSENMEQARDIYSWFSKYTEIENLRNYPDVFAEGENVVATEKIHGSNVRIGYFFDPNVSELQENYVAGSRRYRRKIPIKPRTEEQETDSFFGASLQNLLAPDYPDTWKDYTVDHQALKNDRFWFAYSVPGVIELIRYIKQRFPGQLNVVIYGEVFGNGIQKKFDYSFERGYGFRVFCIKVNEIFLDYSFQCQLCNMFGVPMVPEVFHGPYNYKILEQMTNGLSNIGRKHIREGIVIKSEKESWNPKIGRKILKFVGSEYLSQKDMGKVSDFTEQ